MFVVSAAPTISSAQSTGVLDPTSTVGSMSLGDRSLRARLLVDPSQTSPVRSSASTITVTTESTDGEVRIQLNFADIRGDNEQSSLALGLAGPLNTNAPQTDLLNNNGLVGSTRVEALWTRDISSAIKKVNWYGRAAASAPRFEYMNDPGGEMLSPRKPGYSIEGGTATRGNDYLLRAGIRLGRAYRSRPAATLCQFPAGGGSEVLVCKQAVIGSPIRESAYVSDAEARFAFEHFSVGLTVSRNLENSVTQLELPVWIGSTPVKSLGGGFKITHVSEGPKRTALSLFVGVFDL